MNLKEVIVSVSRCPEHNSSSRDNDFGRLPTLLTVTGMLALVVIFSYSIIVPSARAQEEQVVAVVSGDKITAKQLAQRARINGVLQQVRPIPEYYQFLLTTQEGRKSLERYQQFILERMIEETLQLQKAKEKGFKATEEDIDNTIQQIIDSRDDVENLKQLKATLEEQGSSMDELREQLRKDILLSKLKQEVVGTIEITMGEIKEFYNNNPEYFKNEEGKVKPFDQIKSNVAEIVKQNKANKAWSDWLEKVKKEADIERKLSQNEE